MKNSVSEAYGGGVPADPTRNKKSKAHDDSEEKEASMGSGLEPFVLQ